MERFWDMLAPYDCLACGQEGLLVCDLCWPQLFTKVSQTPDCWAATNYTSLAKELVRSMKIDCRRQACWLIARALHQLAPAYHSVVVTSVPTASVRIRERGFDQGRLIAQEFASLRKLPYQPFLIRHGKAKQAGASKSSRLQQISGNYQVKPGCRFDKPILLIDDVSTTGATLTEITTVLHRAGAGSVSTLVFAIVQK